MKKSLFVSGLDYAMTEDMLKELFGQHGTVESVKIITDRYSGQSRGFGFVDMTTGEEAQSCINNMNGTIRNGRSLLVKIKEDKPRDNRSNQRPSFSKSW